MRLYIKQHNVNIDKQNKQFNIDSWCQTVLDLLDLMFAELFVILWHHKEHLDTQTPSGLSQLPRILHTP